ncbi:hypothetical protein ACMFMG_006056 [Clarireedia jacksonii]
MTADHLVSVTPRLNMASANEFLSDDADEQTLALIIDLQLEDLNRYATKGKQREGDLSDDALAIQMQKEELDAISTFLSDRRMVRSIAAAVQVDAQVLFDVTSQEIIAIEDHEVAARLSEGAPMPNTGSLQTDQLQTLDDALFTKFQTLHVGRSELSIYQPNQDTCDGGQAESSSRAVSRRERTETCEACREDVNIFELTRAPCGHVYCRPCLTDLFETAMTDESLFPPRCCRQPISPEENCVLLTADLIERFNKKKVEFETINRTYCCLPTCSTFIEARFISDDVATCPNCSFKTCTICKKAHEEECPNDTALQQILEVAKENGWQRCYACRTLVELDYGCNHMICRCSAQFCYNCGERWKTCTCEQWHEPRLLARANLIVDREQLPGEQMVRNAQVAAQVEDLRENHDCRHVQWDRIQGRHECEECHDTLQQYILRCRHCHIQACNNCRRHRL